MGCSTITTMSLRDLTCEVYDFGDTAPTTPDEPINDVYGKVTPDKNKCLLIHLASAALCLA